MSDRESGDEQHPAQSMFTNYCLTNFIRKVSKVPEWKDLLII